MGEIITFIDSDNISDKNWINNLVRDNRNDSIGAVAGGIRFYKPKGIIEKFSSIFTIKSPLKSDAYSDFSLIKAGKFPNAC